VKNEENEEFHDFFENVFVDTTTSFVFTMSGYSNSNSSKLVKQKTLLAELK
jgi:hypothetical protein